MRPPEQLAMEVWEEEVTALKEHLREGTIDMAEARRRRSVVDEVCALYAQGKPEEALCGNGRLNTPISGYFNRRFAYKTHADWVASLPPSLQGELPSFTLSWPRGAWWVSCSIAPRRMPEGAAAQGVMEAVVDPLEVVGRVIANEDGPVSGHGLNPRLERAEYLHRIEGRAGQL